MWCFVTRDRSKNTGLAPASDPDPPDRGPGERVGKKIIYKSLPLKHLSPRILCKLSSEAAKRKRRRRKEAKAEVDGLVSSFIAAAGVGSRTNIGTHDRTIEDEQSDEDFWTSLPTMANQDRTHVREIPSQAVRAYPGRTVKTRADALNAAALHSKDK